jgi:hypothetical protein
MQAACGLANHFDAAEEIVHQHLLIARIVESQVGKIVLNPSFGFECVFDRYPSPITADESSPPVGKKGRPDTGRDGRPSK